MLSSEVVSVTQRLYACRELIREARETESMTIDQLRTKRDDATTLLNVHKQEFAHEKNENQAKLTEQREFLEEMGDQVQAATKERDEMVKRCKYGLKLTSEKTKVISEKGNVLKDLLKDKVEYKVNENKSAHKI